MTTRSTTVPTGTAHRTLPARRAVLARWAVTAYLAVLLVTCVGTLPRGVRTNSVITADHVPQGWTTAELVRSLEQLGLSHEVLPLSTYAMGVAVGLLYLLTAYLIVRRAPDDTGAVIVSVILAGAGWTMASTHLTLADAYPSLELPLKTLGMVGFASLLLLLYVFPDGRFVPGWTRWPALAYLAITATGELDSPVNPLRWPLGWGAAFAVASVLLPVGAQVYRYRRLADTEQRRRTRGVALSLGVVAAVLLLPQVVLAVVPELATPGPAGMMFYLGYNLLGTLSVAVVPFVVAVAVLRLRLWDLEPVVGAALVWATLAVLAGALYVGAVVVLGQAFREPLGLWLSALAAGVVALAFDPLRRQVRRAVDRALHGERDDPYAVLSGLGGRLEGSLAPEDVLGTIVSTVQRALRLPWAGIDLLGEDGRVLASARAPSDRIPASARTVTDEEAVVLPLVHRGETVARLTLPPLRSEPRRRARDLRLVRDLCRQAGAAVYAARAATDLQRARERVVTAREEERRRLRRDLHDGLGPSMAAVAMKLDAADVLLEREPAQLPGVLGEVREDVSSLMASVRSIAYGLYPPALDQLGLAGALRDHAERCLVPAGVRPDLSVVDVPRDLPAAVESAAYLIACEAMSNVARHASARTCQVQVSATTDSLTVDVADDGTGLPPESREGVGLQSMRERAAELGGRCEVTTAGGGTRVRADLPLPRADAP